MPKKMPYRNYINFEKLPEFCEKFDVAPEAVLEAGRTGALRGYTFETEAGCWLRADDLLAWFRKYQRRQLN